MKWRSKRRSGESEGVNGEENGREVGRREIESKKRRNVMEESKMGLRAEKREGKEQEEKVEKF